MKHIYIKILLIITVLSCKAQTPIVPIDAPRSSTPDGAYFKDLDNEFDKFIGTWKYTDGNRTFTIILKKGLMLFNGDNYHDRLLGEYKYEVDGNTIVNTLNNIENTNKAKHNIKGNIILDYYPSATCPDCSPDERRVELTLYDRERMHLSTKIILRYLLDESNPEKITATLRARTGRILPSDDAHKTIRVPYETFIMEKQ